MGGGDDMFHKSLLISFVHYTLSLAEYLAVFYGKISSPTFRVKNVFQHGSESQVSHIYLTTLFARLNAPCFLFVVVNEGLGLSGEIADMECTVQHIMDSPAVIRKSHESNTCCFKMTLLAYRQCRRSF
jgi:hypothetical protein